MQLQKGPQPGVDVEQLGSEAAGEGEGGSSLLQVRACPADMRGGCLPRPQEGARTALGAAQPHLARPAAKHWEGAASRGQEGGVA